MKKFIAIFAVAGFLTACNDTNTNQTTTDTTRTVNDSINAVKESTTPNGAAGSGTLDTATTTPAGVTADTTKLNK